MKTDWGKLFKKSFPDTVKDGVMDLKLLQNFFRKLNLRLQIEECGYADGGGFKYHIKLIRKLRPDFAWFIYIIARKI
jgi:hypothetical protein